MPYYRLENPWSDLEAFFGNELQYTCTRDIDRVKQHGWPLAPMAGQDICGLWVLEDFADVIRFWDREPAGDKCSKSVAAYTALVQHSGGAGAGRICSRIVDVAFNGEPLYPDAPLIHMYPSSRFHPRVFDTHGRTWRRSGIHGSRIPHVTVPDHYVDLFWDGRWHPKSAAFGRFLRDEVLRRGDMDLAIPVDGAEAAPVAAGESVIGLPEPMTETVVPPRSIFRKVIDAFRDSAIFRR